MTIEALVDEGVAFLTVTGDLDAEGAPVLRLAGQQALTDFTGTLRVDLSGVEFMDSMGVSALVSIRNDCVATRHTLILENPRPQVRRVLEVTGLTQAFQIE